MSKRNELETKLASLQKEVEETKNLLTEEKKKILIECIGGTPYGKGCGRKIQVKNLVYIQTHWYTPPHGCTGGDYWNKGEGRFICPHCGIKNRLYNRKEIESLKDLFKNVEDEYKRD
jgi:hypothetical protein